MSSLQLSMSSKAPTSDASRPRRSEVLLPPPSDSRWESVDGLPGGSQGRKRKHDICSMEDLLRSPIVVKVRHTPPTSMQDEES
jgi:hypothetical protein